MAASSSSLIPTPLTHADNQGEGHPRGVTLQGAARVYVTPLGHLPQLLTDSIELADVSEAFSTLLRKSQMLPKTSNAVYEKKKLLAFITRI
ncbi:hypothetical protein TNCV_964871 [Trichonephila clavipes]|nr:hypothetical protein TNCV_964871 [Trichonephila clavipes]